MQAIPFGTKTVTLAKNEEQIFWLKLGGIYLLSWLITYFDMGTPVRVIGFLVILVFALQSYLNAATAVLLVVIIHFYGGLLEGLPGMDPVRVLFIPFFIFSVRRPAIRKFPMGDHVAIIFLISIVSLKITADILEVIQDVPLSGGQTEKKGLLNILVGYYQITAVILFFYFSFTRLTIYEIKKLFNALLIFAAFQAVTLLYIVYQNPQVVLERETLGAAGLLDKQILWRNPYFGHKNDWGMLLAFVVIVLIVRLILSAKSFYKAERKYFVIIMIFCALTVAISLSRQAYVWTILGSVMIAFGTKNIRYFIVLIIAVAAILITRPKFIMDRMETMLNVSSAEDFQQLNRKVSDQAWDQAVSNWQWHPRMFFVDWEYNYSEGFWNGMLHQQGILGFLFHIYIYIFLLLRYFAFYKHSNQKLSLYGLLGIILVFLMFFACFNRRSTHILHYKGFFTQINVLLLFMFCYIELVRYAVKKKLSEIQYL